MHFISVVPQRNQPLAETYLSILLGAGNKSTNGLATFAVRRTWRLRSSVTLRIDIAIHRRDVGAVPFPMGLQSGSHGRIGQILQPRSQRESSTCADRAQSLSSPCPDQGSKEFLPGAAIDTVVVGAANLRCYLRFNCDARLVNKRTAGIAHRRFGKWRYYADLPIDSSEKKRDRWIGRARGKTIGRGFPVKSPPSRVKPAKYLPDSLLERTCAGGSGNTGEHTCACNGGVPDWLHEQYPPIDRKHWNLCISVP